MKVLSINIKRAKTPFQAIDSFVGKGLRAMGHSNLPDIDIDYQSDRRQEMKDYLEERYNINGKQRVFSAGTFTTLQLKAVLADVSRVHKVPVSLVRFITKLLPADGDWTTLFTLAFQYKDSKEKYSQISKFINKYPQVIEDIRAIMGQPKSTSIHASAIIVTPETRDGVDMECFDYLPIRKMDNALVSEFDGYSVDELGLLKEDVLGTKELSKLSDTINIVNEQYHQQLSIPAIIEPENLKDEKTYKALSKGYTQNVFQFSSNGITKFIMEVKPDNIEDLIAINALYRPATLEIKATDDYVRYKKGEATPVYNYGTYEATKGTYGIFCYQESFMSIAHTLGGFDLGKTDVLRKAIGKKKADLMATLKDEFIAGALKNGCPDYEAEEIWHKIELAGKYSFNRCISGNEKIRLADGTLSQTIQQLFDDPNVYKRSQLELFNDSALQPQKLMCHSFDFDHTTREANRVSNELIDIRFAGHRKTWDIVCGRTGWGIVTLHGATNNHKHPVLSHNKFCEKRTDELNPNTDRMLHLYSIEGVSVQEWLPIKEIRYAGEQDVFDVEMADPYHNFVTFEGICTCNSHAAAYALTAYCGAWLKANFPTAFYSVALKWADDDELPAIMAEMELNSDITIMHPDINRSETNLFTDYNLNYIFWPLTRVKFLGVTGVNWIVEERDKNGPFTSVTNFIHRVFKYKLKKYAFWDDPDDEDEIKKCPVNARHVKNLILSGCFDEVSDIKGDLTRRYALLEAAARELGFELKDADLPPELIDKPYFWSMQQIQMSGVGAVDYQRLYTTSEYRKAVTSRVSYMTLNNAGDLYNENKRIVICGLVIDSKEMSFMDKKTGEKKTMFKTTIQQNNDLMEFVVWDETFKEFAEELRGCKTKIIIATCVIKYSEYTGKNGLQSFNKTQIFVL